MNGARIYLAKRSPAQSLKERCRLSISSRTIGLHPMGECVAVCAPGLLGCCGRQVAALARSTDIAERTLVSLTLEYQIVQVSQNSAVHVLTSFSHLLSLKEPSKSTSSMSLELGWCPRSFYKATGLCPTPLKQSLYSRAADCIRHGPILARF